MQHLIVKGDKLYALMRGAKFWQGQEDIASGVIVCGKEQGGHL